MITREQLTSLPGAEVHDRADDKIGTVGQAYVDDAGQPSWISVRTGWFGMKESLVPLHTAQWQGDYVRVPYEKERVKEAPNIDAAQDEPLASNEVLALYQHYGLGLEDATETRETGTEQAPPGADTDDAITRSEERMRVGTERRETGRARLRKYVVTEQVQTTVPVEREEVRVEREPITDANRDRAYAGPEISEAEHEVVLHEERPVVEKETVPVERVRMDKEAVVEEEAVGGEVRKEEIETETDEGRRELP